jgi:NifU-like protein involved in Fe-S cluster formation
MQAMAHELASEPPLTSERRVAGYALRGQVGEPGQGPWFRLLLQLEGETFTDAQFETYGCPTALRCGDWLCRWLVGRTPEQASVIEAKDLILVIGGVPLGKEFCADLAVGALQDGLSQIND